MDINAITQLIGSLGFPIVACGALFFSNYKQNLNHAEESKKFAEAINNNTLAITKMTTILEEMKNGND